MSNDGVPEFSSKQFGRAVAKLRTSRKWSRAKLTNRLLRELDPEYPKYDSISESFIRRIEEGRVVKLPRPLIEAVCRAFSCTPLEEAHLLLQADRNVLGHVSQEPTRVAEMINFVMAQIHREAADILSDLVNQRHASELTQQDMYELVASALELVITNHRAENDD